MQQESKFNKYLNNYLNNYENDNNCLISGDEIKLEHVTLPCNHKFNYEEIYNELTNQKKKTNTNEIVNLLKHEIKCPYCRKIHKYLLPYNENYKFNKSIMEIKQFSGKCIAILKSGKNKGNVCNRKCEKQLCYFHRNYIINININE